MDLRIEEDKASSIATNNGCLKEVVLGGLTFHCYGCFLFSEVAAFADSLYKEMHFISSDYGNFMEVAFLRGFTIYQI